MADHGPELQGFLLKLGAKGPVKRWKKRWFKLLNGKNLYYYQPARTTGLENAMGFIDVDTVTGVYGTPGNLGLRKEKGEWVFQVDTPGRVYYLMANSGENMDYWVNGITSLLPKNTVPDAPTEINSVDSVVETKEESSAAETQASFKEFLKSEPVENGEKYEYAQLYVKIMETEGLLTNEYSDWNGIYPILMYEKQEVKMTTLNNLNHLKWNEGQYFDVYDLTMELRVTVWGYRGGASMKSVFLGEASFPIKDIKAKTSIEGWFPLQKRGKPAGQVKANLTYTKNSGKVNVKDFELLKVVGRGNFGKVMQVRKRDTQRIYAMKVLRKDSVIAADAVKHTLSESSVLRRINHPFIVNLKYAFQTKDKLYMILDYLNGGELFFHLSNVDRFSESRAKMYAAEIVLALGYLHENQIVYRDLKPENLLLDMQGHVCVTDFGLVKEGLPYGQLTYTFCGSPEYLAPEILQAKGYGRAVDWWALGTFLYEMLEGLPPFYDDDISVMNCKILTQPLYFHPDHFSKEAKDILKGLLERDPNKRLGASREGAEEIKRHPFFKDVDWDMLYHRKVEPEFKPHLACATDTKYFDEEFTRQTPKETYVEANPISESAQLAFNGFSYAAPSMALEGVSVKDRRSVRYAKAQTPGGSSVGGAASSEGKSRGMNMPRKV
eukprot:CAMPEP_0201493132 /NCGR_PEP_ID=MMETSP0151_2-20130828/36227_1 /ASSEMBLY_ACC=CAM_ASM_000257 /TAXON_ID=200890 /ORGANISM="Paramoeba atlantica, Strain 621/1 / CCAP 1560/9" /LENGTH=663 /DNA_ID=CAMNT_0047880317 /DNA_START=60 /DNA_END=2051 /DNA_ORIENTATION=+